MLTGETVVAAQAPGFPGDLMNDSLSPTICPAGRLSRGSGPGSAWMNADGLLRDLLQATLIRQHDWDTTDNVVRQKLVTETDSEELLKDLVTCNLLTAYQVERIQTGQQFGLVLGNYRVLGPLGRGAMGQVFK